MATKIGNLNVKVTAETKKFSGGMKRAKAETKGFGSAIKKVKVGVSAFAIAGAAGILAVGASLTVLTKKAFETIDATAKLADSVGATVEGFTGMRFAAGIAGVGAEEVEKAYAKMERGIGQARQGLAGQVRAFDALGLSADQLAAKDPTAAMTDILDALGKLPSAADKAAVASDIFGKSGLKLLPLANEGAEGIKALIAEADSLGLTFTRIDAAKIEQANDSVTRLKSLFQGAVQVFAIQVAPIVTELATRFVSVGTSGEGMGAKVVSATKFVAKAIAKVADTVDLLKIGFKGLQFVFTKVIAFIVQKTQFLSDTITDIINIIPGIPQKLKDAATDLNEFRAAVADDLSKTADNLEKDLGDMLAGPSASEKVEKFFTEVQAKARKNAESIAAKAAENRIVDLGDEAPAGTQFASGLFAAAQEQLSGIKALLGNAVNTAATKLSETQAKIKAGPGKFEQVVLSRIALGSANQRDSEPKKQTDLLTKIANNTARQPIAVAA
jgi:hypothetical protein